MYIHAITFLVHDYDEAIHFFIEALSFSLLEDIALENGKRWVRVAPSGGGVSLLLARASTPAQEAAVGRQAGDRVLGFVYCEDFADSYARMKDAGVRFLEAPRTEPYGTVAVFKDLYGNKWDLLQPVRQR